MRVANGIAEGAAVGEKAHGLELRGGLGSPVDEEADSSDSAVLEWDLIRWKPDEAVQRLRDARAPFVVWTAAVKFLLDSGNRTGAARLLAALEDDASQLKLSREQKITVYVALGHCACMDALASLDGKVNDSKMMQADQYYTLAQNLSLENSLAWEAKAWFNLILKNWEVADSLFTSAENLRKEQKIEKKSLVLCTGKAALLMRKGEYKEAAEIIAGLIHEMRVPPGVWIALGYCLAYQAHYESAYQIMEFVANNATPGSRERTEALVAAATFQLREAAPCMLNPKGKAEGLRHAHVALECLIECVGPCEQLGIREDPRAPAMLAEVCFLEGDVHAAKRHAARALEVFELELAEAASNKDRQRQSAFSVTRHADIIFQYARALHATGDFTDAQARYREAIELVDTFNSLSVKRAAVAGSSAAAGSSNHALVGTDLAAVHPSARLNLALILLGSDPDGEEEAIQVLETLTEWYQKHLGEEFRSSIGKRALGVAYYSLACKKKIRLNESKALASEKAGGSSSKIAAAMVSERRKYDELRNKAMKFLCEGLDFSSAGDENEFIVSAEQGQRLVHYSALASYAMLLADARGVDKPEIALKYFEEAIEALGGIHEAPYQLICNAGALVGRSEPVRGLEMMRAAAIAAKRLPVSEVLVAHLAIVEYNICRLMEMSGHPEAMEAYEQFLVVYPNYPEAYTRLGCMYEKVANYEEAERYFREALKKAAELGSLCDQAKVVSNGFLIALQGKKKQYKALQHALEETVNKSGDAYSQIALICFLLDHLSSLEPKRKAKMLEQIGTRLYKVMKENPSNVLAVGALGCFYMESGMVEDARDCFQQIVTHPVAGAAAKVNLAHSQLETGIRILGEEMVAEEERNRLASASFDQATALYTEALQSFQDGSVEKVAGCTRLQLLYLLGRCHYRNGKYEQGIHCFQQCVHWAPQYLTVWFALALCLMEAAEILVRTHNQTLEGLRRGAMYFDRAMRIWNKLREGAKTTESQMGGPAGERWTRKHGQDADHCYQWCKAMARQANIKHSNALDAENVKQRARAAKQEQLQREENERKQREQEEHERAERERLEQMVRIEEVKAEVKRVQEDAMRQVGERVGGRRGSATAADGSEHGSDEEGGATPVPEKPKKRRKQAPRVKEAGAMGSSSRKKPRLRQEAVAGDASDSDEDLLKMLDEGDSD
ncbi:RNA polymerase-associated protein CTR9-like [Porphyridium purpureum]|uniref:RNA polymerase-associated protein CTR9-like n=1 Tax=Porphyridium purpureum TaxID=35688 RepID=A0A5J4Z267_PORPP|nr:RNA polymerase-associated protein CTR9-like [Porphyridium purpureum]|eukprot:POR8336..scf295_1